MRLPLGFALGALVMLGCATASQQSAGGSPGTPRWSANLQQTQQRTGELAPTGQQKATGTILLTPTAADPGRMQLQLTVSAPSNTSSTLRWGIFPGRCGASSLPLVSIEVLPAIDVGSNGRGQISAELPLRLEPGSLYHVNVFRGRGTDISDVLTCGNLRQG